jgi:hypothetical protein
VKPKFLQLMAKVDTGDGSELKKKAKRKQSKLQIPKPKKLRVMIEHKKEFSDIWDEAIVTRAWDLESLRVANPSHLRNLYGEDIARRERQELEE